MIASYALLIIITFIWGMGFIAVKWTLSDYTAMESNYLRFLIATFLAIPIVTYKRAWRISAEQLKGIAICAFCLFGMLVFQTWGLEHTTVAKSGFLTTLYAFFTPMLCMFLFKQRYSFGYWVLILISLFGIYLLGDMNFSGFNFGDFLTVLCSLCAGFHILAVEKYSPLVPSAIVFNCFQIFFVAAMSAFIFIFQEKTINLSPVLDIGSYAFWGFFVLSFLSSLVAFSFQASAQKKLPSHVVSMLFLLESPFAALMGYLLLNEALSPVAIVGCGLIMLSVAFVPKFSKSNPV